MLEQVDTQGITVGEQIVLMRWDVVEIISVKDDGSLEGNYIYLTVISKQPNEN